jgi:hypothetical protein
VVKERQWGLRKRGEDGTRGDDDALAEITNTSQLAEG